MDGQKQKEGKKEKYSPWQGVGYVLKTVWKEDRALIFLSALRIPTLILLPLCAIYLPKLVVELVTGQAEVQAMLLKTGGLVLAMIVLNIYKYYSESVTQVRSRGYYLGFQKKSYQKLMDTDYENVESFEGQNLRQKALPHTYGGFGVGIDEIINSLVIITSCCLGFLVYCNLLSKLTPLIIVMLLVMTGINYFALKHARDYESGYLTRRNVFERRLYYLKAKESDFTNGKDTRLYQMLPWFEKRHEKDLAERNHEIRLFVNKQCNARIIGFALELIRDGVTYGYLLYLVFQGRIPVADFVLYTGAVAGFSVWISDLIDQINWIARSGILGNQVREYLEMKDRSNRGKGAVLPSGKELPCEIEFRNVTFSYEKDKPIFKDFNLVIPAGEKLAIVGVNGAGKTTLVKLMCGLYQPDSGEVLVNGRKITEYNRDEYLTLFSAAFQDVHLMPVTIAQNVAMAQEDAIDRNLVKECLSKAGLWTKVDSWPNKMDTRLGKSVYEDAVDLSGGEAQKLVFARALYRNAPIMILDEPTAALDAIAENEMYLQYRETARGKTSIFISHRLASTRFCDRIILVENGTVLESGTHDELMKNGANYARMFEIQSQYYQEDSLMGEGA